MAQKFGNFRWVKEGFLDNRVEGSVVGRITFAVLGPVDLYLRGDFRGEIAGKAIRFRNTAFEEDDLAGHALGDLEIPLVGEVSLISFDPHPFLERVGHLQQDPLRTVGANPQVGDAVPGVAGERDLDDVAATDPQDRELDETVQIAQRGHRRDEADVIAELDRHTGERIAAPGVEQPHLDATGLRVRRHQSTNGDSRRDDPPTNPDHDRPVDGMYTTVSNSLAQ